MALSYLHRSIDVKFIFDSARLGLFSSANILQIAETYAIHIRLNPKKISTTNRNYGIQIAEVSLRTKNSGMQKRQRNVG